MSVRRCWIRRVGFAVAAEGGEPSCSRLASRRSSAVGSHRQWSDVRKSPQMPSLRIRSQPTKPSIAARIAALVRTVGLARPRHTSRQPDRRHAGRHDEKQKAHSFDRRVQKKIGRDGRPRSPRAGRAIVRGPVARLAGVHHSQDPHAGNAFGALTANMKSGYAVPWPVRPTFGNAHP